MISNLDTDALYLPAQVSRKATGISISYRHRIDAGDRSRDDGNELSLEFYLASS